MRPIVLLTIILAPSAQRLAAQDACGEVAKLFAKPPTVGAWSEVRMEEKSGEPPKVMRMAVVGTEKQAGKTVYRMQMTSTDPRSGQRMIIQMLTPWGMDALNSGEQKEVILKLGDQPAMRMPRPKGVSDQDVWDLRKQCAKGKFVGQESITVPAGSYRSRHYTGPDGDTWLAAEVPVWHVVKNVDKDGSTMTLTAVGAGAKNEIRETPVDFKTMMNNPEAMKKLMGGGATPRDSSAR